ncbi:hypothetical protein Vadar_004396 [Vaccinium darrowii]|uniref:Uncharacterized protein n=1 Tax=Vaccinium darrowii TaxID=229202 RepID=A0ACB7Z9X1_9ERIC|nr:hypothetical protein Vadar_004396 [Vaccinium darrowii]
MPEVLPRSCQDKCGNVTIPFPFGIGKDCYLDEKFKVECNKSSNSASSSVSINGYECNKISEEGYVTMNEKVFPACYNKSGYGALAYGWSVATPYSLSPLRNKFVAIGCDIYAYILGDDDGLPAPTGCASFCNDDNDDLSLSNRTSTGRGYCETALSRTRKPFGVNVTIYSVNTFTRIWTEKPCSFAFPVDREFFQFEQFKRISNSSDWDNGGHINIPMVYDWAIGNISCREASKSNDYLCGRNAECRDANEGGYNCYCQQGYQGNPYLSNGCQVYNPVFKRISSIKNWNVPREGPLKDHK